MLTENVWYNVKYDSRQISFESNQKWGIEFNSFVYIGKQIEWGSGTIMVRERVRVFTTIA